MPNGAAKSLLERWQNAALPDRAWKAAIVMVPRCALSASQSWSVLYTSVTKEISADSPVKVVSFAAGILAFKLAAVQAFCALVV